MNIEWSASAEAAKEEIVPILRALADPTRLAVFLCIRGCGGAAGYDVETGECDGGMEGGVSLCDIRCHLPCAPSTLTHHLNALREAGLIVTEKRGRVVYTRICPEVLARMTAFFSPETK